MFKRGSCFVSIIFFTFNSTSTNFYCTRLTLAQLFFAIPPWIRFSALVFLSPTSMISSPSLRSFNSTATLRSPYYLWWSTPCRGTLSHPFAQVSEESCTTPFETGKSLICYPSQFLLTTILANYSEFAKKVRSFQQGKYSKEWTFPLYINHGSHLRLRWTISRWWGLHHHFWDQGYFSKAGTVFIYNFFVPSCGRYRAAVRNWVREFKPVDFGGRVFLTKYFFDAFYHIFYFL